MQSLVPTQDKTPCRCCFMEADWDLHAVVRGCSSAPAAARLHCDRHDQAQPSCVTPSGAQIRMDEETLLLDCRQPFQATRRGSFEDLRELYKPFFRKPQPVCWQNAPPSCPSSSSSSSLASSLFERTKSVPPSFSHVQRPAAGFRAGSQASKSKKR